MAATARAAVSGRTLWPESTTSMPTAAPAGLRHCDTNAFKAAFGNMLQNSIS
jgi:hypothetical protein